MLEQQTKPATALELAQALVKFDDDHDCRLCSKWQWGEEYHDDPCPMKMAYRIIGDEMKGKKTS